MSLRICGGSPEHRCLRHTQSMDVDFFVLFMLILDVPVNSFSVMSGQVYLCCTSTKQRIKCLAQRHNTVPPVRREPATPRSWVMLTILH